MLGDPLGVGEPLRSCGGSAVRLSVVVPTRNEAGNLRRLEQELEAALASVSHEVIVVDDSTDHETRPLLRELASRSDHWRVLERPPPRQTGLATAVTEGMAVARGDSVCVMDADLQHPPPVVAELLAAVEDGTDLAVASRYTRGGRRDGLAGVYRHLVSGCSRLAAHLLFPESRRTADPLSGFFCIRRTAAVGGLELRPVGFKILLELLVLCPELRVVDIPFVFGRRAAGGSKADATQGLLYLRHLASLFVRGPHSSARLRFALISLSCLVGFMVGFELLRLAGSPPAPAWLLASLASLLVSGALQRAMTLRASGGRSIRRTLGPGRLLGGLVLYAGLARLAPGHPLGMAILVQGVVLVLPLGLDLATVRRSPADRSPQLQRPATPEGAANLIPLDDRRRAPLQDHGCVSCSVGIMAHNEEANIGRTLRSVLAQDTRSVRIEEVIVVASGCTDGTVAIVAGMAEREPRLRLCIQERREGKASAVNLFLKEATCPIVVLSGADVIPGPSALEQMCGPFEDSRVGMVGGRPVPVNDPCTFMGHVVHLLWRLHDYVARTQPKLGELVAFRNVISGIPADTSVDEISIQALISQLGYRLVYEPACIVYNKGPVTVRDFVKQRRRIYAGHLLVREQQRYDAPTMKLTPILRQLMACRHFALSSPTQVLWTLGAVLLEGFARVQGYGDYRRKHAHHIWQMVESTKNLETGTQGARALSLDQNVLVFRFIPEGAETYDVYPESSDRQAAEVARRLLPLVRARIRKDDRLSISGPGVMTAVIRVEQHEAELVARGIQEAVQATPVNLGIRGRPVRVTVAYSVLTFGFRANGEGVTVSSSLIPATAGAAGTD